MKFSQSKGNMPGRAFASVAAPISNFFVRLYKSAKLMSKSEKKLTYSLLTIFLVLIAVKANQFYIRHTQVVPAFGGSYREEVLGEVKYLNPVLAKSDTEKSISGLIYDGLVKVDEEGNIVAGLAKEWEISSNGLTYTFILREDASFHNGQPFDAGDVIATINLIKDPSVKSTHLDKWKDVKVSTPDPTVVEFELPSPYGPFLYQCMQGIMSKEDINSSLIDNFNGTGPYKFTNTSNILNGDIKKISLVANTSYFERSPYIKDLSFDILPETKQSEAKASVSNYSAGAGFPNDKKNFLNMDFETERQLALIANLRRPAMADAAIRKRSMNFEKGDQTLDIKILALDAQSQRDQISEFEKDAKEANINLSIEYVKAVDYQDALLKRDYDLALYGFNFGYDRDPYVFWHSSKYEGMNLAGYKDKSSDILLEDARMIADAAERNAKYDEFFGKISTDNIVKFFPLSKYEFSVKFDVKGVDPVKAYQPEDRFAGILDWYLTEKRVRK